MKKLVFFFLFCCVLLFQNCGQSFGVSGNGNGYGGFKIDDSTAPSTTAPVEYVFGGTCSDGEPVSSRIVYQNPSFVFLERENCVDLNPRVQIDPREIVIDGSNLHYRSRTYQRRE